MRTRDTEKKHKKRQKISHGRTRNFTEKDRSRTTEKTGSRKYILATEKTGSRKDRRLATEGHGISLNKTEAETRKKVRKDRRLDTEKIGRRKYILATE